MTGDVLARIDDAVADWEASPHAWVPGDPIYPHPDDIPGMDSVFPQPMALILDDLYAWVPPHRTMRCEPCQVSWVGPEPCWVCGVDRPRPFDGMSLEAMMADHLIPFAQGMERAIRRMTEMYAQQIDRSVESVAALVGPREWTSSAVDIALGTTANLVAIAEAQDWGRAWLREWAPSRQQPAPLPPSPLGEHYRRRQLARRRRNRR